MTSPWQQRSPYRSLAATAVSLYVPTSALDSIHHEFIPVSSPQIIPLLSQSSHPLPSSFSAEQLQALTTRIQFGGDEVVKAKDGAGSATLSMAYAGAQFAEKVIRALKGEKGLVAPSYVHLSADKTGGDALKKEIGKDLDYFSAPVEIGVRFVDAYREDEIAD